MKKKLLLLAFFALVNLQGFAQAVFNQPDEMSQCGNEVFDLTTQILAILGDQSPNDYTVTFYTTQADATANTAPIATPTAFVATPQDIVYVRVTNNSDADDFAIGNFSVSWYSMPQVSEFNDVSACGSYILPLLVWPEIYYTATNGGGTQLASGTAITTTQTIYIGEFNNSCFAQSSFTVTITGDGPAITLNPIVACDDDGDGIATFDLTPAIQNVYSLYDIFPEVTFYETSNDAQFGTNPITNISAYTSPMLQPIVYVRIETQDCVTVVPLPLVIIDCATNNTLSGYVRFDEDNNGCTATDAPAAGTMVYYTHNNINYYTYTDENGYYEFINIPNGSSTFYTGASFATTGFISTPAGWEHIFPNNLEDINFCLTNTDVYNDVLVYMYPVTSGVPGFTASYMLVYQNAGTTTAAGGNVTLDFDSSLLTYTSSNPAMTVSGNMLNLSYTNLQPFETQIVYVDFLVSTGATLNDVLTFTATVSPISGDSNTENNTYVFDQNIVSSFDPNDIFVNEGDFITMEQAGDYLNYTIRFQNTGTANATFVKLQTTLNSNLDLNTFQPVGGSHNFVTNRTGNQIEFFFDDINLAYEDANEPESHGFVTFRVKPKNTVSLGDVMTGQANIYFDYNPLVATNTAITTVQNVASVKNVNTNSFIVYPNPASGRVVLQMQNAVEANVTITDVLGKTVQTSAISGTQANLDVSALKTGVYFVTVKANGTNTTKRLMIN